MSGPKEIIKQSGNPELNPETQNPETIKAQAVKKVGRLGNVISLIQNWNKSGNIQNPDSTSDITQEVTSDKPKKEKKKKLPIDILAGTAAATIGIGLSVMSGIDYNALGDQLKDGEGLKEKASVELTQSQTKLSESKIELTDRSNTFVGTYVAKVREKPLLDAAKSAADAYAAKRAEVSKRYSTDNPDGKGQYRLDLLTGGSEAMVTPGSANEEQRKELEIFDRDQAELKRLMNESEVLKSRADNLQTPSFDSLTLDELEAAEKLHEQSVEGGMAETSSFGYYYTKQALEKNQAALAQADNARIIAQKASTFNAPQIEAQRTQSKNIGLGSGVLGLIGSIAAGLGINKLRRQDKRQLIQIPDEIKVESEEDITTPQIATILDNQPIQAEDNQITQELPLDLKPKTPLSQRTNNNLDSYTQMLRTYTELKTSKATLSLSPEMQKVILEPLEKAINSFNIAEMVKSKASESVNYAKDSIRNTSESVQESIDESKEILAQYNNLITSQEFKALPPKFQNQILSKMEPLVNSPVNKAAVKSVDLLSQTKILASSLRERFNKWWNPNQGNSPANQEADQTQIIPTSVESIPNQDDINIPESKPSIWDRVVNRVNRSSKANLIRSGTALGAAAMVIGTQADASFTDLKIKGLYNARDNAVLAVQNEATAKEKLKAEFAKFQQEHDAEIKATPVIPEFQALPMMRDAGIDISKVNITRKEGETEKELTPVQREFLVMLYKSMAEDLNSKNYLSGQEVKRAPSLTDKVDIANADIAEKAGSLQQQLGEKNISNEGYRNWALGINASANVLLAAWQLYKKTKRKETGATEGEEQEPALEE
jgi:hypothetical protein